MTDSPAPETAKLPPEATRLIWRWRWAILLVGLLSPLSASIVYVVIGEFPDGPIAHWVMGRDFVWTSRPIVREEVREAFGLAPVFLVTNWPFLVLAIRAENVPRKADRGDQVRRGGDG